MKFSDKTNMYTNKFLHMINRNELSNEIQKQFNGSFEKNYAIEIDCRKCKNEDDLFDEISKEFNFPNYFGRNMDALIDCLTDLNWLEFNGIVLVFHEASQVMLDDNRNLGCFLETIGDVVKSWREGDVYYDSYTESSFFEVIFTDECIDRFIERFESMI